MLIISSLISAFLVMTYPSSSRSKIKSNIVSVYFSIYLCILSRSLSSREKNVKPGSSSTWRQFLKSEELENVQISSKRFTRPISAVKVYGQSLRARSNVRPVSANPIIKGNNQYCFADNYGMFGPRPPMHF